MEGGHAEGITFPLITRADGTKFGKTADGKNIWLDPELTSPYEFYQYWLNLEDAELPKMLYNFSLRPKPELDDLLAQSTQAPEARIGQRALAEELTTLVHGAAEVEKIRNAAAILFGKGTLEQLAALSEADLLSFASGIPHAEVPREQFRTLGALALFAHTGLCASLSEAKRTHQQGGLKVNKNAFTDANVPLAETLLLHQRYLLLQSGKKNFLLLKVTD
jgi:tyrosyl-tRNA synthetase